jgi:folate-dependent phosphoribosylglycinamide formyltransferase PurN
VTTSQDPLRLCLLLGTESIPEWFARAVEHATADASTTVSLIVSADRPDGTDEVDLLTDVRRKKSWVLVAALQKLSESLFGPPTLDVNRQIGSTPALSGAQVHRTTVEEHGEYGYRLSDADVALIGEKSDLAVHFGVGILYGGVLDAPERGVIGFHHGDLREYRGGPPGFWEFVHGRSETGVTVQRFTETLDGGEILAFEDVPIDDAGTWSEVRRRQRAASEPLLLRAIENIRNTAFDPDAPGELGPVYTTSQRNWRVTARYIRRELAGRTSDLTLG